VVEVEGYVLPGMKNRYPGFTPADISAVLWLPGTDRGYIYLGRIAAISISTHRDKFPVVALGREHVKGFTRGPRMVAGSIAFATFDSHGLWEAVELARSISFGQAKRPFKLGTLTKVGDLAVHADELPPFDVLIVLVNEMGDAAFTAVRGVEIVDDSHMFSVDDPEMRGSMSYMAREHIPLQPIIRETPIEQLRAVLNGPGG
jgi:hypothetical protein